MIDYKLNIVLRFCVRFHQEYTVQIKNTDIERDKDRPDILYKNRDPYVFMSEVVNPSFSADEFDACAKRPRSAKSRA